MKKILICAASLVLVLSFGCAKKAEPLPSPVIKWPVAPTRSPAPTPVKTPAREETEAFFHTPTASPSDVHIVVTKSTKTLELYADDAVIARFPVRLGENAVGIKEKEGDKKTPEGEYYICTRKDKDTANTLFMGISYPNKTDAQRGLSSKLIDQDKYDDIAQAIDRLERPTWSSPLGGAIGIHGKYDDREFTQGCIAVSDDNVRIIWAYTKMGTKVTILP